MIRGGPSIVLEKERIKHMEERLRAIERGGNYAFATMAELCLVPDVVIPPKFKVPDFDKYKCRNLPFGGRATRDSRDACSTKGIRAESPPTFI